MPPGLARFPSCPQAPRPKATNSCSVSVPEAPPPCISRHARLLLPPVNGVIRGSCLNWEKGPRPAFTLPVGGGGRGRVENLLAGPQNPGHLAECWGLHLQPLPCAINTGQGLRAPAFLGLSLLSFPGLFCSSPISCAFPTPSPIIIRGNFRARKGASSSLGLIPIPYPEGVGARDILQVFPWWGWFSLDHLPV